ncbi:recombinase family protein [Ruminiclostridium cellobioparum]|uniref:recombinase family protein n=1 Tax=Ruminiclostridium cellobioparum TaxID=29355 RepID=UPI0028A7F73A|nr:recombinase family protein [Ruminiclostridium cellobioparum]
MSDKQEKVKKITNENPVERQETVQTEPEKRVCIYRRVRTRSSKGYNTLIARQTEYYKKMIALREDWKFIGIYADAEQSGVKLQERDGLIKMMKDCETGKIDLIITKSFTQFLGNTDDSTEIIDRLRQLDIGLFSEEVNINTQSVENDPILSILSALAQIKSERIVMSTVARMMNKRKTCDEGEKRIWQSNRKK